MEKITEETIKIEEYINKTWPQFETQKEIPLKRLFAEPGNKGLKHIWKYGSADLVVWKKDKLVCIIEPGGSHHFTDEKQIKNDKRKWMLCEKNGVRCMKMANGLVFGLSNRQRRKLLGRLLFGLK